MPRSKSNIVSGSGVCFNKALSRSDDTASEGTDKKIGAGGKRDPAFFRKIHGFATPYAVRHGIRVGGHSITDTAM